MRVGFRVSEGNSGRNGLLWLYSLPAVVLEFDGIGEIREGSTELRHGETAEDSEALTEGLCSTRQCELPRTLIFVQGRFRLWSWPYGLGGASPAWFPHGGAAVFAFPNHAVTGAASVSGLRSGHARR